MAKSLRSKWKRKCRAVKRVRYGQKELERLKNILGVERNEVKVEDLENVSDIAEVKKADEIVNKSRDDEMEDNMDVDAITIDDAGKPTLKIPKSRLKNLRNEHGSYPVWLHPRKIPKKNKKGKKKILKRGRK